jgi:hypothetical protein
MRNIAAMLSVMFLLAIGCTIAAPDEPQGSTKTSDVQIVSSPSEVKWGPAPPVVPGGAQAQVLDGDPFRDGSPYTLRLKMPDGYRIAPHWHPTDENVTVLSGTLGAGMGRQIRSEGRQTSEAWWICMHAEGDASLRMGKRSDHRSGSRDRPPFAFTYVNAADDPRNKH